MKKSAFIAALVLIMCLPLSGCNNILISKYGLDYEPYERSVPEPDDGGVTDTAEDPVSDGDAEENDASGSVKSGGSKRLIADEITSDGSPEAAADDEVQSLAKYCNGNLTYAEPSNSGSTVTSQKFEGDPDDFGVIEDYIDLITSGNMNFRLQDTYEWSYKDYTNHSYALEYTGGAKIGDQMDMMFKDGVRCDANLWVVIDGGDLEATLRMPSAIKQTDLGYRCGGSRVSTAIGGGSALAGLYLMPDGSFMTTDERLSANLGETEVISDGTKYVTDTEYIKYGANDDYQRFCADNYYRTDSIYFSAADGQLMTGDIYTLEDMEQDFGSMERYNRDPQDFNLGMIMALCRDGQWRYPDLNDSQYEDMTVRVMYYEKDVAAVLYTYARLKTSPTEVEALMAIDLSSPHDPEGGGTAGSGDDEKIHCPICGDTGVCPECHGSGKTERRGSGGTPITSGCSRCHGSGECPNPNCDYK